jgi:hypothetical protein
VGGVVLVEHGEDVPTSVFNVERFLEEVATRDVYALLFL